MVPLIFLFSVIVLVLLIAYRTSKPVLSINNRLFKANKEIKKKSYKSDQTNGLIVLLSSLAAMVISFSIIVSIIYFLFQWADTVTMEDVWVNIVLALSIKLSVPLMALIASFWIPALLAMEVSMYLDSRKPSKG